MAERHWTQVQTELGMCWAVDFLDGVLLTGNLYGTVEKSPTLSRIAGAIFISGWTVKMKTGDMDYNKLVKR